MLSKGIYYTFSDTPYTSLYDVYNERDSAKKGDRTANNLEVSSACRKDDNTILFLSRPSVLGSDAVIMSLHLDTKLVEPIEIEGVKTYGAPIMAPDHKGIYISLMMQDATNGMYYYDFATAKATQLFSMQDILKDFPMGQTVTETSTQLIVQ